MDTPLDIRHNETAQRFEARVDGWLCRADYRRIDAVLHLVHTEVPPALEGRGIAAQLVKAALDFAEAQGLKVRPRCSYVLAYLRRHPERAALVD
jgi:predicted GNAT family acetyltransferase